MVSRETRVDSLKTRMRVIDLMNEIKKTATYQELSKRTNLPVTVLARYAKGHVIPTEDRAQALFSELSKIMSIEDIVRNRLSFDEHGYLDALSLTWDLALMRLVTYKAVEFFAGTRITKVLTAAVDGIPIATLIANELGVDMVVAKSAKEVGVKDFVEESYIPHSSAVVTTFYLPKNAFKRSDNVLIVDDVVRTGETQRALVKLVQKMRAGVAGMFAIVAIGEEWKSRFSDINIPIYFLVKEEVPKRR